MAPLAERIVRHLARPTGTFGGALQGRPRYRPHQGGAFAVMSVPAMLVMLAMCGLAIDIGMIYNRKVELHGIAKTVALAAVRELDGTADGITRALGAGRTAASAHTYRYGVAIPWLDSAISFSTTPGPGAEWISDATARSRPAAVFYVKVDTSALDSAVGTVGTIFMPVIYGAIGSGEVSDKAVAGRSALNVTPFAVCAMSAVPGAGRTNSTGNSELVEYGFRRGVTYDLMALNPNGTTPVNFVVDPVSPPGGLGATDNTSAGTVAPFICTGRMWTPRVTGGAIRVTSPFPIGSLYQHLNSRFDDYSGGSCNPHGAPPDFNIKAYAYDVTNGIPWMNPKPTSHSAAPQVDGARLQTVADSSSAPASAGMYGPLWSYARAVKFSTYREGVAEPTGGYPRFATSDWSKLYPSGPSATSYPSSNPYFATSGNMYLAPRSTHLSISEQNRRVLHIPLLSCPVSAGTNVGATALAVGKFFMTVPATPTSLFAEFVGIAHESTIPGQVTLYP
ncbi:Flp pilus assembly protein TadG [Massilia sp. UYP11]|uniref:pilus assembly protein TadG-related protein n=1 Tax=Massilia sp. UYP11 TaxID=1756385 RepID=UPI003D1F401D